MASGLFRAGLLRAGLAALALAAAPVPLADAQQRRPALERALGGKPLPPPPQSWSEDATRDLYDGALNLRWKHPLGDWRDAEGQAQGEVPFASAAVSDGDGVQRIRLDVTRLVRAYGGDILLRRTGGAGSALVSREGGTSGPRLVVTKRGETLTLPATADTGLDPSTYLPLGTRPVLPTRGHVLVRFDVAPHPAISSAILELTTSGRQYGAHRLGAFRPDIGGGIAMPRYRGATPADRVARWTARDLAHHRDWRFNAPHARIDGDILTAWIPRDGLTAFSMIQPLPGGTEAFATIIMRFDANWAPPNGGKLPGLSNSGQGRPVVDGLRAAGWGGRTANGLRWTARTGFDSADRFAVAPRSGSNSGSGPAPRKAAQTGLHSYYYALAPGSIYGEIEPWSAPVPKGRWFAYTQHVRLNTPGRDDGQLGYWLDGTPVFHRGNIRWRDRAGRESEINEYWLDIYCGGTTCGPAVRDREHRVQIASITVDRALPDFRAVTDELARLNGGN